MSSEDDKLYAHLCEASEDEDEDVDFMYNLAAIQNPSLPVIAMHLYKEDVEDSDIEEAYFNVLRHLHQKGIIVFDEANIDKQKDSRGKMYGVFFHFTNPRYSDILKKNMSKQLYHDKLFEALEFIESYIKYCKNLIRSNQPVGEILLDHIAIPQANHVWKQALNYDDLITKFWCVPIRIMEYMTMTNVKTFKDDDSYATVRQLVEVTRPHFQRLFPDPAPLGVRLVQWILNDEDIFECVLSYREHFVVRKKLLESYADLKKPESN